MNEAELTEHLMAWFSQISGDADRYFTLVSAYLVVAYLVGKKLTVVQLTIINTLFLLWTGGIIVAAFSAMEATSIVHAQLGAIGSAFGDESTPTNLINMIAVYIGGVIASFVFMWSVRHPKNE